MLNLVVLGDGRAGRPTVSSYICRGPAKLAAAITIRWCRLVLERHSLEDLHVEFSNLIVKIFRNFHGSWQVPLLLGAMSLLRRLYTSRSDRYNKTAEERRK